MWHLLMIFGVSLLAPTGRALICTRRPANTATPKSPVDENYVISITGNPETYILGQEYNVSLNAFNGHRYISFILALESEEGDYQSDLGRFELSNLIETRFSPNCINMVENTNTNPKTHMHLTWTAPSEPGSGCILIRATVLQHRDVWHMDDGGLTRRICEEVVDDVESQPTGSSVDNPCCACDEARYELTFEGVWSRNLHPKNFPARGWETRFCELVGAAHSSDYRFWESGGLASEAIKQYAEHCTSRLLEREFSLNFREQKIRTIIKARGPAFPNLNSKTMASVRVDPLHHMVSFASKIEPSPDWIVGVSGLELCLRNCTWLESKTINLYPWDVGTDAGPTYTSPDQPQVPPDVIRRIRPDFPNDPRSPFYDESGEPMKPMATLTIRRQRIYERRCLDEDSNNDADVPRECLTHPWSGWSDCSSKCGEGMQYRRRVYKQPELARIYQCNVLLYEERACEGQVCGQSEPMRNMADYDELGMNFGMGAGRGQQSSAMYPQRAECQLSPWSGWGPCSVTCGEGYQTRQRQYLSRGAEMKCQSVHRVELQEMRTCAGRACLGNLPGNEMDSRFEEPQPEEEPPIHNRNNFNNNEEEPTEEITRLSSFDVGNLKGVPNQWKQEQRADSSWPTNRWAKPRLQDNNEQFPRLEDAERSPYQRRRPLDSSRQQEEERFTDQRQRFGNIDYASPKADDDADSQSERTPWQRPSNNFNKEDQRFPGQRQRFGNNDYANPNIDNTDSQSERSSWQRPSNNFNKFEDPRYTQGNRKNAIGNLDPDEDNIQSERLPWQRNSNNYGRDFGNINSNGADNDPIMSKNCFQMLRTNPSCRNQTIVGNFWFYNFCADECMLYAADPCDRNVNKFSRWETCEECRRPEFQQMQQNAAASPECQNILTMQRAQQQFWSEERVNSNSRRNYGNRQWG